MALAETHKPTDEGLADLLSIMDKNHQEIKLYSDVSEENFLPLAQISEAGIQRLKGNYIEATELLEAASGSAEAGNFLRIYYSHVTFNFFDTGRYQSAG